MPERPPDPAIVARLTEFEAAVRRVAIELVREVLARELAAAAATFTSSQRSTKLSVTPVPARRERPGKPTRAATTRAARKVRSAVPADPTAAQVQVAVDSSPTSEPTLPPNGPTVAPGDVVSANVARPEWSRTRVVTELADWLLQEPSIDAATLKRRGQGALASWALRVFGRFDAALNAANLHLAEKYPDGPPKRGVRPSNP